MTINAKAGDTLTVLVENMGRANFGPKMMRLKGLPGRVLLGNKIHFSWNAYPLSMTDLESLSFAQHTADTAKAPAFYRGTFEIAGTPCDTFLRTDAFTKGFVILNGFNLGRFWEVGPQKTLYVPASVLKKGQNTLTVFESDGLKGTPAVEFTAAPELG